MTTLVFGIAGAVVLVLTNGAVGSRTPGNVSQIVLVVLAVLAAPSGLIDMNGAAATGLYLTFFGDTASVGVGWGASGN